MKTILVATDFRVSNVIITHLKTLFGLQTLALSQCSYFYKITIEMNKFKSVTFLNSAYFVLKQRLPIV